MLYCHHNVCRDHTDHLHKEYTHRTSLTGKTCLPSTRKDQTQLKVFTRTRTILNQQPSLLLSVSLIHRLPFNIIIIYVYPILLSTVCRVHVMYVICDVMLFVCRVYMYDVIT